LVIAPLIFPLGRYLLSAALEQKPVTRMNESSSVGARPSSGAPVE